MRYDLMDCATALEAVQEIGFAGVGWGLIEDDGRVKVCRYVDYRRVMLEWFSSGR